MEQKLNIGAGNRILQGYLNTDVVDRPECQAVVDINRHFLLGFDRFSEVRAEGVLEYAKDLLGTMKEIHYICAPGALVYIDVPYRKCSFPEICCFDEMSFHIFTEAYPYANKKVLFKIRSIELIATPAGKLLPARLRNYLAHYWGNLVGRLKVVLEVVK